MFEIISEHYNYVFLVIILIYNFIPKKIRPIVLLLYSLLFFAFLSKWLVLCLITTILSVYIGSLLIKRLNNKEQKEKENADIEAKKLIKKKYKRRKKFVLLCSILINVAFLFLFKYLKFFTINLNTILDWFNINKEFKVIKFLAPIGISFYSLSAISYIADVYNGKIEADKNIFRVALFISFFPQIIEGPIARYSDTANDLYAGNKITYHNFCFAFQRILYGIFKKMVIADRLNILVKMVFTNYTDYNGIAILLGAIGYTIMLYMEFSGTMDYVLGVGELFGVKVPENFRQPFFSKNISEFWTRWHISLGTWFKDYIYYPISLSKPLKKLTIFARKILGNHYGPMISGSIALLVVWLLNGLWHGAGYTFILFGLYHFVLIFLGNLFEPLVEKVCGKLKVNRKNIFYRIFQSIKMTFFVFIGELIFRAETVSQALFMIKRIFFNFTITYKESLSLGLDHQDYIIVGISLVAIFIIGLLKEKGHDIRTEISNKNIFLRWLLYYLLIFAIIIFGAYGAGYVPVDPMYADF